jgi:hypothetical protein
MGNHKFQNPGTNPREVRNETIAHEQNSERLLLCGILDESNFGFIPYFEIWIPNS